MTEQRHRLLRRAAAGLIGGVLVWVLVLLGVLPLWEGWQATADDIDRSSRLLAGYQRVIDDGAAVNQRLLTLQEQEAKSDGLAGGATSALAVANLQSDLKQLVEAHGGRIQSIQPGAVTQSHGFDRLEVKLDLSVAGDAFPDLMAALDSHRPVLSVDPLEIHSPENGPQMDRLTIRMTVSALRRSVAS